MHCTMCKCCVYTSQWFANALSMFISFLNRLVFTRFSTLPPLQSCTRKKAHNAICTAKCIRMVRCIHILYKHNRQFSPEIHKSHYTWATVKWH